MPAKSYSLWQPGLYLVIPAFTAVICFITFDFLSFSGALIFGGSLCGALLSVGLLATVLNYPRDSSLATQIAEMEAQQRALEERANAISVQLMATRQRLEAVTKERTNLLQSIEWRREALLQRDWKSFRDDAWEAYLAEVFTALGGVVQRTGRAGDQGVDLVVQFTSRCIAVQAKGYYHAVTNHAVQEVVAGMAFYNCDSAAVITNSRFTRGAIDLAERNNSRLSAKTSFLIS